MSRRSQLQQKWRRATHNDPPTEGIELRRWERWERWERWSDRLGDSSRALTLGQPSPTSGPPPREKKNCEIRSEKRPRVFCWDTLDTSYGVGFLITVVDSLPLNDLISKSHDVIA
jgi:hypothetical protein